MCIRDSYEYRVVSVRRDDLHPALHAVCGGQSAYGVLKPYAQRQSDAQNAQGVVHREHPGYAEFRPAALGAVYDRCLLYTSP